jgi:2-succinyl-5-enolpyruvyl-6-hydroxy-3-cyclohexene-1-carboxylate synthase
VKDWRELAFRAVVACTGGEGVPAGPVHLNLALREPLVPTDDGVGFPYDLDMNAPRMTVRRTRTTSGAADLAAHLAGVKSGVVVVGDAAGDPEPIVRWCEAAGWPLIAEPHSNARRGAAALRGADILLRDSAFVASHRPDLVIVIGRVGLSRAVQDWLRTVRHVVVSPDGGNWDTTRSAAAVIIAVTETLNQLAPEAHRPPSSWLSEWGDAADRAASALDRLLNADGRPNEPRIARDVARLVPSGGALVVASSMPIRDLDLVMEPRDDITVYANRGVSGIDGFVSTAIGVARGRPQKATVALCGDLSLLHDINGLALGPEAQPDLTYVVINNDGGGIFSLLPQGDTVEPAPFERLFGTPHGVAIDRLASAYGVEHRHVSSAAELAAATAEPRGIRIVEIRTDRAANADLHARMREIRPG